MKKTMVYILALSMLAAALLAGCGETGDNRNDATVPPDATGNIPEMDDITPDEMEPDPRDGEVNDTDGFITEGDNAGGGTNAGVGNDVSGLTAGTGGNGGTAGGTNDANGGNGTGGLTVGNSGNGDTGNR